MPWFFTINRKSVDTVHLEWGKPLEPNGVLIGYQLKYQTGERPGVEDSRGDGPADPSLLFVVNGSRVGPAQFETFPPNVTEFTLRLPDRSTSYRFHLSAVTQVGSGEVFAKEMSRFTNEGEPFTVSVPEDTCAQLVLLGYTPEHLWT